ncbi:MAG TPA: hypothetical protein PKJ45_13845 [Rubrivivax sp.]|nr:hypothetical protein [Rubrivivax sp.]
MTDIDPSVHAVLTSLLHFFPHIASDISSMHPDDLPGLARTLQRMAQRELAQ